MVQKLLRVGDRVDRDPATAVTVTRAEMSNVLVVVGSAGAAMPVASCHLKVSAAKTTVLLTIESSEQLLLPVEST